MLNKKLFTKIMALTTSDFDGEALSALRKANAMLKEHKMSWEELLLGVHHKARPEQTKRPRHYEDDEPIYRYEWRQSEDYFSANAKRHADNYRRERAKLKTTEEKLADIMTWTAGVTRQNAVALNRLLKQFGHLSPAQKKWIDDTHETHYR